MLKLIGELAVGALAMYAVRKPATAMIKNAADPSKLVGVSTLGAFGLGLEDGVAIGAITTGAVLTWPVAAPIGAFMLGKDLYNNRTEVVATVKAVPAFVADKSRELKAKFSRTKDAVINSPMLDIVADIADAV